MTTPYKLGEAAWKAKESAEANPFPSGSGDTGDRTQWFDGFYDARIAHRLGPIFRKYGIDWP